MQSFDYEFMIHTFFLALKGIPMTLVLTFVSFGISMPLGFLMAVVKKNKTPVACQLIGIYVSYIRGTPLILQIFLLYNLLPTFLNFIFKSMHVRINIFNVSNTIYAIIVFVLCETAILEEVFRSALGTVDKGQLEAAGAIGLSSFQGYRHIVIPQAIISALPVLCNSVTDLIKMTSLAFTMSVLDMTAIAKMEGSMRLSYIEAYTSIFLLFLILVLLIEHIFKLVERKFGVYQGA
jgi:L-cystine transport system permease protein